MKILGIDQYRHNILFRINFPRLLATRIMGSQRASSRREEKGSRIVLVAWLSARHPYTGTATVVHLACCSSAVFEEKSATCTITNGKMKKSVTTTSRLSIIAGPSIRKSETYQIRQSRNCFPQLKRSSPHRTAFAIFHCDTVL
jgi:hypothetical protein